ncbi:type I polyketide synthase, partial [Microbispora oryzae]
MMSSSGEFGAPASAGDGAGTELRQRLAGLPEPEAQRMLTGLVTELAAAALRRPAGETVAADGTFFETGLDSLTAVELHGRLTAATGLALPVTLAFDYPTPAALARHLYAELLGLAPERVDVAAAGHADEPIAIVGMACRFPGGVRSPEALWRLVESETDAIGDFPTDRGWDLDALYSADPDQPGTSYTRRGGFLYDAAEFDADFFGINPREALAMDAQQRLVLETSWEALERAGIPPETLREQRVGVFVGAEAQEYGPRLQDAADGLEGYLVTGTAGSVASGRVSYALGLQGPALTIDTACSSSLVALHLAAQALRQGECSMALAGGVAVMASPASFVAFSRQRGLAADGRCKPFSAAADGTGWAEGVGMLLVERLSSARAAGRRILAVIRGSAVNQDGASNGLTAPNGVSQQRVIRQALANARLDAADVDAVEAHGTGTTLGDPIEAQALLATYGQDRVRPLWLGSIKSNIGHTQAAAGVGGVIKMVEALQHGVLPKTLHVDEPTPHVDWRAGTVRLLTDTQPWPETDRPRRAAVSSFGMSGTNAHLILEAPASEDMAGDAAPGAADPGSGSAVTGPFALPVSGRTPEALAAQAANLLARLDEPDAGLADLGFSLATTRTHFAHRAVVLGTDREQAALGLAALAGGEPSAQVVSGIATGGRTAFLFTGQGSQRLAMGRELYAAQPVFAAAFDEAAWYLDLQLDRPLADALADEELLGQTGYAQPAIFAVEVALFALARHWGFTPDVLIGHSIGEIAAAHAAGVLSISDAAALVGARGRLMQALPAGGAMLAVQASEDEVRAAFPDVDIAAVNGPGAVVLSGIEADIERVAAAAGERGWKATRLRTSHAFHSRLMEPMLADFRRVLRFLTFREPKLPIVSTVTGRPVERGQWSDPEYWVEQVRRPVRFADALAALDGVTSYLELGPDAVLTALAQQAAPDAVCVSLLRRDRDEAVTAAGALAALHVNGVAVNWPTVFSPAVTFTQPRVVDLPTYAFQRQRFWLGSAPARNGATDPGDAAFWAAVDRADLPALAAELGVGTEAVAGVLPALASWRARGRERSLVDGWRYRITWRPASDPARDPAKAGLSGTWALAGEDVHGLGAVLSGLGAMVVPLTDVLMTDMQLSGVSLTDGAAAAGRDLAGVVASSASPAEALALVQALATAGCRAPLWLVTRGAVATGRADGAVDVGQAALWGFGRVIGLEHPELWGGLLDLPEVIDARSAARIGAVLAGTLGPEDQVAVRGGGVLVRRLERAPAASGRAWRPRGTILITGGTGGLGARVARWAAANGAERLVLVSRRGGDAPGAAELLAELPNAEAHACDLADRPAVEALLATVGSVDAVVHAAGVGEDATLADADRAHLDRVIRGKVDGASHLDALVGDVDAFVVFSSISGIWGSRGQAAYGAANAALDALVERRRAAGRPGTAVAWGPWAEIGMAADQGETELLRRQGLVPLAPAHAIAALAGAIGAGDTTVTVADVRWAEFLPLFTAARARPLFDEVPEAETFAGGGSVFSAFGQKLAGLPAADRGRVVADLVRAHVAAVLGHSSGEAVAPGRAFKELGFDSLTAVELRNRLQAATGLVLPATLAFDYPSAERLAAHVLDEVSGSVDAVITPGTGAVAAGDDDPVVIVGMGCRFPGGADTPEALWELVASGSDAIGGFPADRGWDLEGLYHPDPDHAGTSYTRHGGFLYEAADFDAGLFGISPREALAMDPQQRLLLETSWEALERGGLDPLSLRGAQIGVFAGSNGQDYAAQRHDVPTDLEGYLGTGTAGSVVSGRISYTFGLEGPAMTVDTACSSSLVALHLAVQALRSGECSMALVGGVTVMATPDAFLDFSRQRGLSVDGRCKPFAAAADGTGWAEGAGMLLVERLSSARAAGRRVLAVVRGTAVNQDGASNGLTAPNGPSQQRVIRAALASAGLSASDVDAVEAHGTGTTLGDPIEAQALLATYGQGREQPLWLGSVKSNIGHTQAAAGVAGIIKMVQAMRHDLLPATLHVDEPSAHVDWSAGSVELLTEARPWLVGDRPRRAGVSAFGVSGTNAHVILEEPPAAEPVTAPGPAVQLPVVPVLVSGQTENALRAQAQRLRAMADADLAGVGLASVRRGALPHRAVVLAGDAEGLASGLDAIVSGTGALSGVVRAGRVGFLFTGQGAQRVGMGRGLYGAFPVFADAFDQVALHVDAYLDRPLVEVLADEGLIDQTGYAQPALFAVEVALHALVASWGVAADVLVGHSVGEIAAAHVAGVLSLSDAATLVTARGRLMQALPAGGAMLAVGASEAEVLGAFPDVDVAAVNGPDAVVVSGTAADIDRVAGLAAERGWKTNKLRTSHAFHSRLMEPMLAEFGRVVHGLAFGEPSVAVVSTVTGRPVEPGQWSDPQYWVEQVRKPVRFAEALTALDGVGRLVELGPDGVLTALAQRVAPQPETVAVPLLRRDRDEVTTALTALATLHVNGVPVDWTTLLAGTGAQPVDLPTYAFQRERYWLESRPVRPAAADPIEAGFWATVEQGDVPGLAARLGVPAASLENVLPALASWRARGRERSQIEGWRYRVTWKPADLPSAELTGRWVLVGEDRHGIGAVLSGLGASVTRVAAGTRTELATRLAGLEASGVVAGPASVGEALALVQALTDVQSTTALWLVTRSGVATGRADEAVEVGQAVLWGFGRVVGLEHPELCGGLLDLPQTIDSRAAKRIGAVLAGALGAEDQVAVRGGGVLVRRLEHAPASAAPAWQPRGTVLITGGTGGLGAQVARWAAANGAERLVLVSRRGVEAPGAAELLAELPNAQVYACDLADRAAVEELLAAVGQVDAVVHAAGVAADVPLRDADEAHFRTVLSGKVDGALHLDALVGDIDAFVVFSSISGIWGSAEQAAYGAANAALDGLVARRRARGLPGTAVAWGPWAEVGMAADDQVATQLRRRGLLPLDPGRALAALADAVGGDEGALTIADVRWDEFVPVFAAARTRPLFDELPEARTPTVAGTVFSTFGQRLAGLPAGERERLVADLVRTHVAAVLGHTSGEAVAPGRAFKELGFDSLTAVELRNRLRAATGLTLAATLAFDYPSAERLTAYLLGELSGSVEAVTAPVAAVAGDDDPVVIVGMGCRFPGGADTPEALWELVASGSDAIGGFPADRGWDLEGLYHPDPDHAGTSYTRHGGFLYEAADFDAGLFGISPREALAMDPQQRLLLETSWEAFERAGIDPLSLRGEQVGVFAGANSLDYASRADVLPEGLEGHLLTGTAASVVSGRISYTFGLEGPAMTVDTACSSSLVALHLAVQALRSGECSMALVGGVAVMAGPETFVQFSRQRGLSADGRCKPFAAAADGTGWSEGAGMLLVERLSDARRLGHPILAVVRGTAVNQDGASNGLTAPNGPSQQRVIRAALASAGLSSQDVDAVEAHGTGTTLGDPIEAQALLATYGRDRERPLWLGSIKSNIGHTQAAAGIAGIIKMVQAMRHDLLPETLHVDEPSPHVDWTTGTIELLTSAQPWQAGDRPRRAGVSSFGMSGTNAHVILEEPPAAEPVAAAGPTVHLPLVPVLVSGHTEAALRAQAERVLRAVTDGTESTDLAGVGATSIRRAALAHRAVVLAGDAEELASGLGAVAAGAGAVRGTAGPGRVGFLFTGQGAQRVGMGRGLYGAFPVFADAFDQVALHVDAYLDRPLAEVLADEALIDQTGYAQPALFAVEVALHALVASWGVAADVLVGHSVGEIAAAHVAGVLSLSDAATLVTARGRLMQALPAGGAMLAVGASEADVLEAFPDVDVAAVNGPDAVVVSGAAADIDRVAGLAAERGWKTNKLRTSHAFHSRLMEPMLAEFGRVVRGLAFGEPSVAVVSTVTGRPVEPGQWSDPQYWVEQVRKPVRFAEALTALDGVGRLVELGPDGVLTALAQRVASQPETVAVPLLRRDRDELTTALTALATLHVNGVPVDWSALHEGVQPAELPTYAFQRERYWPDEAPAGRAEEPGRDDAGFWTTVERGDLPALAQQLGVATTALEGVVPALASWRARGRERSLVDGWRYRIDWEPMTVPAQALLSGVWAVAGEDVYGLGEVLAQLGASVLRVTGAEQFAGLDLAGLIATPASLADALRLVQALVEAGCRAPLWWVTRNAVATGRADGAVEVDQAALWGMGRAVALEHPELWGGLLDLPQTIDSRAAKRIGAVLAGALGAEDQIAVRAGGVLVRRLASAPASDAGEWRPTGTVLITGGTGGLGAQVARWAAANGAERLVLVSRRGADAPGAAGLLAGLPNAQAYACDLADRSAVEELLAVVGRVDAVVHAAGVGEDVALVDADEAHLDRVIRGKVDGALHLDALVGDVDAFVVFSSISGIWGSAEQTAYGAANAALDALVARRRANGRPGTAVSWGPWAQVGMAADEDVAAQLRRRGLTPMDPARALTALAFAVGSDEAAVTVADVRWAEFLPLFTASRERPLFARLAAAATDAPQAETGLAGRLASLSSAERHRAVLDLVRTEVAAVLGHASTAAIEPDRAFKGLGFDSLTAVELRNRLQAATGLVLPATLVFDYPTAERLTTFALGRLTPSTLVSDSTVADVIAPASDDPIVIVGMGLRLPGGVETPEQFWDLVAAGGDGIGAFPADRGWDLEGLYHPDPDHAGTFYAREGGFLYGAGDFDAGLFGISPREALAMDPQQRLLLETSWEAFERAGVNPLGLRGEPVGVF